MIITSSIGERYPLACFTLTYCCCKKFVAYLARGLAVELKDKIDVLCYAPGAVSTKLTMRTKADEGLLTVSPEKAV